MNKPKYRYPYNQEGRPMGKLSRPIFTIMTTLMPLCLLFACSDDVDADGDGKISTKERAEEMQRDGYLAMNAGRWRTQTIFSDIDLPKLSALQRQQIMEQAGKKVLHYSCLSKAEAAQPGADFFGGVGAEDCTYTRFDIAGNNADMALNCKMGNMGKADLELKGTVGFQDFAFDSKVIMHIPMVGKAQKITMTATLTGKHEGPCKGDE
jgi:Protein of unknown function (DUF3617)